MRKHAVVLFNMGGPDTPQAVKPFLFNLFGDRDIFNIPVGQKLFAKIMSSLRAPKVRERYKHIGGKSPLNEWTEMQRAMLGQELQNAFPGTEVFTAMRYWNPTIADAALKILEKPFDKIVLLPLYPHYSITTTGSAFNEWSRVYRGDTARLKYVYDYFDNPKYIAAVNARIDETISGFPVNVRDRIQLVFSAHGTPESLVKQGDPYAKQIDETVRLVMEARNFSHEHHLCFQSKVGPAKWLEPATDTMIKTLAAKGKKQLLLVPISFVSDHIETLFELDMEYRAIADQAGIENYIVMKGLNDSKVFVSALQELAVRALQ
ncbi:MAG: ferrochelatase [Proteobacteria bacterium]|nr:ferrochelatase [Pseudomonadota bacterium]